MNRRFLTGVSILVSLFFTASKSYAWNQPPVAVIYPYGEISIWVGDEVNFDGYDSYDPDDDDIVDWEWYLGDPPDYDLVESG